MVETTKELEPVTLKDFDGKPGPKLTTAQIKAIKRMVYYRACLMRGSGRWTETEEAAFMNGAMCAFFACRANDQVPAFWLMSNRRLLDNLATWKAEGKKLV